MYTYLWYVNTYSDQESESACDETKLVISTLSSARLETLQSKIASSYANASQPRYLMSELQAKQR